ncbi:MAG: hypothetical protein AAGJ81_05280, partial [Verrucomicrobiota bacterium]
NPPDISESILSWTGEEFLRNGQPVDLPYQIISEQNSGSGGTYGSWYLSPLEMDIEPDENMVGVIGDIVPSVNPDSVVKHFVTPKRSNELNQEYVILKATKGITADMITPGHAKQILEWEGGEEVPGEPLKRRVKRDEAGKTEVRIKVKQSGGVAAEVYVWTVWANGQKVADHPIRTRSVPDIITGDFTVGPGVEVFGGYDFNFSIIPKTIITHSDDERPDLSGENTHNGTEIEPPGTGTEHFIKGMIAPLENGVSLKWDVSRRARVKILNPHRYPVERLDIIPGFLWDNQPIEEDIPVTFPDDERVGNDDGDTGDEDNNPYQSTDRSMLAHGIGEISSFDIPVNPFRNSTGSDGDTFEIRYHFGEFSRLLIGSDWYRISDYLDWRIHFKIEKENGVWIDDGSTRALDNEGF